MVLRKTARLCVQTPVRACLTVLLATLVAGCAAPSPAVQVLLHLVGTGSAGEAEAVGSRAARLNPALTYLYLGQPGQDPAFLVLGYIEPGEPPTLVWFSANREVVRTRAGHLTGLAGLPEGKAAMRFYPGLPSWSALTASAPDRAASTFTRAWDVPEQYRFGLRDTVTLSPVPPQRLPSAITRYLRNALGQTAYTQWQWFEATSTIMPTAWYAVAPVAGQPQVVYSLQCLSAERCLHLAPWPVGGVALP